MKDPLYGIPDYMRGAMSSQPPGFDLTKIPRFKSLAEVLADHERAKSAGAVIEHVLTQVRDFEASLDDQHEVAIHLVSFGQALSIRVREVGFIEPSIVIFAGLNTESEEVRLIQHFHQLSFLLWKAPRLQPDLPRVPIGFITTE